MNGDDWVIGFVMGIVLSSLVAVFVMSDDITVKEMETASSWCESFNDELVLVGWDADFTGDSVVGNYTIVCKGKTVSLQEKEFNMYKEKPVDNK